MNSRPDLAVNIWRRMSMVFYSNDVLDKFQAPPIKTAEDVVLSAAYEEARVELIKQCVLCANEILTPYQKEVFDLLMKDFSKYKIAAAMGWENLDTGYWCIFVALFGRTHETNIRRYRVGGIYKKLRLQLENNSRVIELLDVMEKTGRGDLNTAIAFLKTTDKAFWDQYSRRELEDG